MDPSETPGQRLKGYIRARWNRKNGGDTALAKTAGISRQTLQAWYAGEDMPRLDNLEVVAAALGVRRVDLVAAYDGVIAPEQQETPRPEWAGELEATILSAVEENRKAILEQAAAQYAAIAEQLHELGNDDEGPPQSKGPRPKQPGPQTGPTP